MPETGRRHLFLIVGLLLTALWTILCAVYVAMRIGWAALAQMSPGEQGGLLAGYAGALAFLWVLLAFLRRDRQLAAHMASLEAELARLREPLGAAEAKAASLGEALRQRAELVSKATAAADGQLAKAASLLESQSQGITAAAVVAFDTSSARARSASPRLAAFASAAPSGSRSRASSVSREAIWAASWRSRLRKARSTQRKASAPA